MSRKRGNRLSDRDLRHSKGTGGRFDRLRSGRALATAAGRVNGGASTDLEALSERKADDGEVVLQGIVAAQLHQMPEEKIEVGLLVHVRTTEEVQKFLETHHGAVLP